MAIHTPSLWTLSTSLAGLHLLYRLKQSRMVLKKVRLNFHAFKLYIWCIRFLTSNNFTYGEKRYLSRIELTTERSESVDVTNYILCDDFGVNFVRFNFQIFSLERCKIATYLARGKTSIDVDQHCGDLHIRTVHIPVLVNCNSNPDCVCSFKTIP